MYSTSSASKRVHGQGRRVSNPLRGQLNATTFKNNLTLEGPVNLPYRHGNKVISKEDNDFTFCREYRLLFLCFVADFESFLDRVSS
jgi:hypothetical protein